MRYVRFKFRCSILISGEIIKEMPGLVASGTPCNRGNCNHIKIIQKIPEKPTGKARNQGTAESSHTGHPTHTSETTNVKVQKSFMGNNITCTVRINHGIATKLYVLKTRFI